MEYYDIGADFAKFLSKISRQRNENNSLQWYLSGSLAATILGKASSITDVVLDENNNIVGGGKSKSIDEEQRRKLQKFSRKLGMDIDVVNVNGNFFRGAEKESKPSMGRVRENVSGINELMNWGENQNGTAYIDNLDYEREINKHHVASVIIDGQEILVTAPPEQLAHKLHETMVLREMLNESETDNVPVRFHYEKDIRDVSAMFYGYKDLYDRQELLDRVYTALTEKDGSILEREGFNFESYLRLILEDSRKYMNLYEGDKTFSELSSFFARIK